jgi:hypothetical protein
MKKIGTTLAGTVIVEMSAAQFEALAQLQSTPKVTPDDSAMSLAERVDFVRERILKLSPKKREGVARSISAMFQFTGGVSESDVDEIIGRLQKEKFFAIDESGRVTYKKG